MAFLGRIARVFGELGERRIVNFAYVKSQILKQEIAQYSIPAETHQEQQNNEEESDKLYKKLVIECRAHEPAVLKSYDKFCQMAANGLEIEHVRSWQPFRHIKRRTLLASRHVHKKYRVQYEWRTYYNFIEFKNLTGSTADTYLEYIERNLPEGVMLTIYRHELGTLPFDLQEAPSKSSEEKSGENFQNDGLKSSNQTSH